jgi:hypothetical protein
MSLAEEARTLRRRIAERLAELEPLVREYEQLCEVAKELGLEPSDYATAATGGAAEALDVPDALEPVQAKPRTSRARPRRRPVRPRPPAHDHMPQLLEVVRENPGSTVAEIASIMDVSPTSLYRPIRDLTGAGEIVKRGRALFPVGEH